MEERGFIPRIRSVLYAMRGRALPVAFVNVGFRADYANAISRSARLERLKIDAMVAGTWAADFPPAIEPLRSEIVYTKRAVNPFFNTAL